MTFDIVNLLNFFRSRLVAHIKDTGTGDLLKYHST